MERLRMKNLLLACAVMLGLQFCCPLVLKAGDHAQVAEMISLGVKDAESKVEVAEDQLFVDVFLVGFVLGQQQVASVGQHFVAEVRESDTLLPTTGLYPSAP